MLRKLTELQLHGYRRDGFCFPISAFSSAEVADRRGQLEAFEAHQGHPLQGTQRIKTSLLLRWVDRLIRDPRVLDPVEDLIGPNILCWGVHFWVKEPGTAEYVSWHQDLEYWGLDSADLVTAWVALSPATIESGCMRMQPVSHTVHLPHKEAYDQANMLSRGQTITEGINEAKAVAIVLHPGEMSLHNVRIAHSSGPNCSGDRRIGIAIRYMPPRRASSWLSGTAPLSCVAKTAMATLFANRFPAGTLTRPVLPFTKKPWRTCCPFSTKTPLDSGRPSSKRPRPEVRRESNTPDCVGEGR